YDPADAQTAGSIGNVPKSYTDSLQLSGLRGARIGLLSNLLGSTPEDSEVATVVRAAVAEMKSQGADISEVAVTGLAALLTDRFNGNLIIREDFKADLNNYLANRPTTPVRSLAEVIASGKFHPAIKQLL